jgi:peptidoglycan/xylan/chitin deacetylase (PgdA/CDA1 family)
MNNGWSTHALKRAIQYVDEIYLDSRLSLTKGRPGICGLLFHTVFNNTAEIRLEHVHPQQSLTIDHYGEIFDYFLGAGYQFLSYADLSVRLDPERKYVYVTFDDGYFNNVRIVPILKKLNIPIHIFVTTDNILRNRKYWWDVIYQKRKKNEVTSRVISNELAELRQKPPEQIDSYIVDQFGPDSFQPLSDIDRPITPEELNNLSKNRLVTIGNHTQRHPNVTRLSETEIRTEIFGAQKDIEKMTGVIPSAFAFPYGIYRKKDVILLETMGFDSGFSCEARLIDLPEDLSTLKKLDMGRFSFSGDTDIKWQGKMCQVGGSPFLVWKKLVSRIRG